MNERKKSNFIPNCDAISSVGIKVAKISAIVLSLATIVVATASTLADNRSRKIKRKRSEEIMKKFNDSKKN